MAIIFVICFLLFAMIKINPLIHTIKQYKGKLPAFSPKAAASKCDVFVKQF